MAASAPPVKGAAFVCRVALRNLSGQGFKSTPTLAAGDFKVDKDGAGLNPLNTPAAVDPAGSVLVKISLSATEMNADVVTIVGIDQTDPKEWDDFVMCIQTVDAAWLAPTTPGNKLDVTATGAAGIDWGNVENQDADVTLATTLILSYTSKAMAASDIQFGDEETLENKLPRMETTLDGLNDLSAADVNAEIVDVLRTDTLPDSYAAHEAQPTIAQAILEILQFLTEKSVSSTTVSVKKPDGVTAVMEFTLNSATAPTSITRKANP